MAEQVDNRGRSNAAAAIERALRDAHRSGVQRDELDAIVERATIGQADRARLRDVVAELDGEPPAGGQVVPLRPGDERVRTWYDSVGWELEPDALSSALQLLGADPTTISVLLEESQRRRGIPGNADRWIVIPLWDEFQHYRDRDPVWIKCYTRLLSDDAYLALTAHQRAVLHGLWMQYARSGAHLRLNTRSLSQQLALRVMTRDLEAIKQHGFIEFALAPRKHSASPEKRREEPPISPFGETPENNTRERTPRREPQAPAAQHVCPVCRITKKTQQQLDDHLELVHQLPPGAAT